MELNIPPPDLRQAPGTIVPLSETTSRVFLTLTMLEAKGDTAAIQDIAGKLQSFPQFMILDKRLQAYSRYADRIPVQTRILCAFLCKSPGEAVMWAWTLHRMAADLEQAEQEDKLGLPYGLVNIHRWVQAFPMGAPDDDGYAGVWDQQKCLPAPDAGSMSPDNLLDYPQLWKGEFDDLRKLVIAHPNRD